MTYNILYGGNHRHCAIEQVIHSANPDILAIQEANDPDFIADLAGRLSMQYHIAHSANGFHVAILSRLPVRAWIRHSHPAITRGFLEAVIDIPGETIPWSFFTGHLTAEFFRAFKAERIRRDELRGMLAIMQNASLAGRPHLLMGDFNALTPGEPFSLANLIVQTLDNDAQNQHGELLNEGYPFLSYIVPKPLRIFIPLIRQIPRNPSLAAIINAIGKMVIPRFAIPELQKAHYRECLATMYPGSQMPPTCPNPLVAGRIDYVWADPLAAQRLLTSSVLADSAECPVLTASDHRPLLAAFATAPVQVQNSEEKQETVSIHS